MSDIDWSRAPKGATHYHVVNGFFYCTQDNDLMVFKKGMWKKSWLIKTERPNLVPHPYLAWSEEGLPPVGAVCQAESGQVTIVAHHCNGKHAIYADSTTEGLLYYGLPEDFTPIRTKDQIEADERDAAIRAIVYDLQDAENLNSLPSIANCLYVKGYRKP